MIKTISHKLQQVKRAMIQIVVDRKVPHFGAENMSPSRAGYMLRDLCEDPSVPLESTLV